MTDPFVEILQTFDFLSGESDDGDDILTPGSNLDSNCWGKNCINLEHNTPSFTSRCAKIEFSSEGQ